MGSAATDPAKKPPAKKAAAPKKAPSTAAAAVAAAAKPKASKPKQQKPRGRPTKSSSAAVPVAQHVQLHIPTNLPVCIVDNGGWTVKYGLLPPLRSPTPPVVPPSMAVGNSAAAAAAAAADKNVEGENDKTTNDNDNDGGENKSTADKEGGLTEVENESTTNSSPKPPDQSIQQHPTAAPVTLPQHTNNNNINVVNIKMNSMYNATARPPHQLTVLTGDEITTTMKNLGQLSWNYPLERGMVVDGETQLRVWARVLENLSVVAVPQIKKSAGGGGAFLSSVAANSKRGKHVGKKQPVAATTSSSSASLYSSNNCTFLLLEPPFVPSVISEGVDCMLFRELGMARVVRMLGPCMAAMRYLSVGGGAALGSATSMNSGNNDYVASTKDGTADANSNSNSDSKESSWVNDGTKCCCVVDSGYSFTHIVPTHRGAAMPNAIRRLNIGGKLLTNLLKESVTYRQWNMMDEYHIVNDAKEQLCFLSNQFDKEMKVARSVRKGFRWFDREYLLPDFVNTFRGSVRLPEPLQRKKEMEEMQQIKKELDRLQEDRERQELEDEARDLASMEVDEGRKSGKVDKATTAKDGLKKKKGAKGVNTKSDKSKQGKKKKRKHSKGSKKDTIAKSEGGDEDDADMDDSENDSDEENDQQRLQRLKAMRDAERRRREQESHERQALAMSVERFAIPEVLFRPSDIGLDIGGIAESIVKSIHSCDAIYRAAMYHNVLLVGGNANIPGFRDRVELELRRLAPTNYEVRVYLPEDPASYAWEGAKEFSQQTGFQERFSVDRLSWEAMKKAGKNQQDIWGDKMHNAAPNRK